MPRLVKLLLLSVLLGLLPTGPLAQKAGRKAPRPSPTPLICTIDSVPNGMVVVGYKRNSACSNGAELDGSELLVKQPETGDIICAESPVPPQFSIAAEAEGKLVGTCPGRAFLISREFLISRAGPGRATGQRTAPLDDDNAISRDDSISSDDSIGRAFATGTSYIQVAGAGTVNRLLPDDLNAPRHQRFILQLASGQTLLVTHNIDVAPRIDGLKAGDIIRFSGEYIWNAKGGVLHWTHHDPRGRHVSGWVTHNGKTYQ